MGGEKRYPWETAHEVAAQIVNALRSACERIEIAGSLRRHKADVGDIEILYIPTMQEEPDPEDFFATRLANLADGRIEGMERAGVLRRRLTAKGQTVFGAKNKLMVHIPSGIPVDLFAATSETWWNQLVCRTGPAELNKEIAAAAISRGWHWNVYGPGFTREPISLQDTDRGEIHVVSSEAEVFTFVGMPCLDPEHRGRR